MPAQDPLLAAVANWQPVWVRGRRPTADDRLPGAAQGMAMPSAAPPSWARGPERFLAGPRPSPPTIANWHPVLHAQKTTGGVVFATRSLTHCAPLQPPGFGPGPVLMGRCVCTNLAKDRADAQRLVTTRLLDRLHDPLGHFSRLQRIHPRAR